MNRYSRLFGSAVIGLAGLTAAALAQESSAPAYGHGMRAHRVRQFDKCLASVGLSADQQSAIDSLRADARGAFQADLAAFKAANEKLQKDLSSGADKSVIGQDTVDKDAAGTKLKNDHRATRDQIVAKLNPDQQTALSSCMRTRHGKGEGSAEEPAEPSESE